MAKRQRQLFDASGEPNDKISSPDGHEGDSCSPDASVQGIREPQERGKTAEEDQRSAGPGTSMEGAVPVASGPPTERGLAGKRVFVIDAHGLIHQVFHALPEMTSAQGEAVGAVFGFVRDLLTLIERRHPDYLFCAFDLPGKTFRHELYERYKIHRPATHVDLAPQFAVIRRVVEAIGIPVLAVESFEADDILATVAREVERQGGDCFLVSGDKDCRQLLSDRIKIYNIRKDEMFDERSLAEHWGVRPEQVVDFQALVGDATDGVPGVPLIGPKCAEQLLRQLGTLEEVLRHPEAVSGAKRKANLETYGPQALLSRDLVRLRTDVPVGLDWRAADAKSFRWRAAKEPLSKLGFRSLLTRIEAIDQEPAPAPAAVPRINVAQYHLVDNEAAFGKMLESLRTQRQISLDTETTSIDPRRAELVGISIAWQDREAWYVALRAAAGEPHLDLQPTLDALRPILEDPAVEKVGQNLKYDQIVLRGAGIELAGVSFDTMVASYLLDAGRRNHNLDDLAERYLDHTTIKITELIGTGKEQKRMDEVPAARVAEYAGEDAVLPLRLLPVLQPRLAEAGLEKLFHEVEVPLVAVLAEMEYNGVRLDLDCLTELSRRYGQRLETLEEEVYTLAGHRFNLASPKQLQVVLFEELKLPVQKKTATGPSTDAEVLEELARVHPLPSKLLEHRQYAKLKGTYVDALPQMIHPATGRVHASFNQVVAATGRLSSSDPNLQNIPVRGEEGRAIRSAFIPGQEGWVLLAADYSQIELRVLAHLSGDARLMKAFERDEDVHSQVAAQVYGVTLENVTPEMRRQAKAINFGVIYGQSPFGLARQLGISQAEAGAFIDAYFNGYPGVEEFLLKVLVDCRCQGCVTTILGRRRQIEGIREPKGRQRTLPERTAINTVVQGSAADLIKLAMLAIYRRLKERPELGRMLLQIHDELVFETPAERMRELADLVAEEMTGVWKLKVPLKVDVQWGANWGQTQDLAER